MFRKFYASTTNTIEGAAILLTFSAILAQLFGLLRDKLLANFIGPSITLDVYYSAFRIPDILFNTIATLFSATILLPFFVQYAQNNNIKGSNRFIRDSLVTFGFLIITVSAVVYVLFPVLSTKLISSFPLDTQILYVKLGRILLLSPIILGISNLISTITQNYKHIIVWSLAPLFYNLGIILGILFYPKFGIVSVALGVVFGALLHLLIQFPVLLAHKFSFNGLGKYNIGEMFSVLKTALPRTLSLSLNNLVMLVLVAVAATMSIGSVSLFTFSYTVQAVPLTLIGLSFSVAAFPVLSSLYAESKMEDFKKEFIKTARNILYLTIISAVVFMIFRRPLIDFLLGSGAFNAYHTLRTSWLLFIACFGMVPAGLVQLYLRALYATGDTKRPFWASFTTALVTIITATAGLFIFRNTNLPNLISNITRLKAEDTFVLILMFSIVASSIINVLLLRSILNKNTELHGVVKIKGVLKTVFIAIISTLVAKIFYDNILNIFDSSIVRYGVFVISLILNTILIYVLAKKLNLVEVYSYLDIYKNKLVRITKAW